MISNFMSGWQNVKERVSWIAAGFLTLCILSNNVMAAEIEEIRPSDMDLIEFIGGWESEDGQWLDPELFDPIFAEDEVVMEEESVLQAGDLKSLEGESREEVPGVGKGGKGK